MTFEEELLEFESKYNPFKWKIDGIPLWYFSRFELFSTNQNLTQKKRKNLKVKTKLKKILALLSPSVFPPRLKNKTLLFVGSTNTRREIYKNKYYNIFFDPLIEHIQGNEYLVLERNQGYLSKKELKKVYSQQHMLVDSMLTKISIQAHTDFILKKRCQKKIRELLNNCNSDFINKNKPFFERTLVHKLLLAKKSLPKFRALLNKINPKIVVVTCGYGTWHQNFIFAAKSLNIPILELQHGLINSSHPAYIFNSEIIHDKISPLPDYLFVFSQNIKLMLEQNLNLPFKTVVSGHPYLFWKKNNPQSSKSLINVSGIENKKIILFTMQINTRDFLIHFIDKVSQKLQNEYHLIIKTHPNEIDIENAYKPIAHKNNITIVSSMHPTVYDLLNITTVHVSVSSVVLHESVTFNIPNIVIRYGSWYMVKDLIEKNYGSLITSPEEFVKNLKGLIHPPKHQNANYYYHSVPINQIVERMRKILKKN